MVKEKVCPVVQYRYSGHIKGYLKPGMGGVGVTHLRKVGRVLNQEKEINE